MSDLKEVIAAVSKRELSRRQFLGMVGGSFVGMIGIFHALQSANTPGQSDDLATSNRQVFGEREYGYTDDEVEQAKRRQAKKFDEDVFG